MPDPFKEFTKKWSTLPGATTPAGLPLVQDDLTRLTQGRSPQDLLHTAVELKAGQNVEQTGGMFTHIKSSPVVQERPRSFFGNVGKDVLEIVGGIFRLPQSLGKTVHDLPQLPHIFAKAMNEGFGEAAYDISRAPGINLIPGTFTLGGLFTQKGRRELAEHPLMTALDVLPATNIGLKAARYGEEEIVAAAREGKRLTPLKVARNKAIPAAERLVESRWPQLHKILPSQLVENAQLGGRPREYVATIAPYSKQLDAYKTKYYGDIEKLREQNRVAYDRAAEIVKLAEEGKPGWHEQLRPNELSYLRDMQQALTNLQHEDISGRKLLYEYGGETYSQKGGRQEAQLWKIVKEVQLLTNKTAAARTKLEQWSSRIPNLEGRPLATARTQITKQQKYLAKYEEALAKARERADAQAVKTPPARYAPIIHDQLRDHLAGVAKEKGRQLSAEDAERLLQHVSHGQYDNELGLSRTDFRKIAAEISASWQHLRDAGYDPIFFHHVGEDSLHRIVHPTINPIRPVGAPPQMKERVFTATSYYKDFAISLTDQAVAFEAERLTKLAVEELKAKQLIRTERDVRAEINARYEKAGKFLSADELAKELKQFRTIQPGQLFPTGRASGAGIVVGEGNLMIPKTLDTTIRALGAGRDYFPGAVRTIAEGSLRLQRLTLLALSPGYYLHTTFGGALLLQGQTGAGVWKYFSTAWQMVKDGQVDPHIARGMMDMPQQLRQLYYDRGVLAKQILHEQPAFEHARVTWNRIQRVHEHLNDTYRVMAYLYGEEHGMARAEQVGGLRGEGARAAGVKAGIELANKVGQNWDRMTPFERQTIRLAMPFYGFQAFLMKYLMSYPFDHPARAAILSNFGRNELDDWGSGLPTHYWRWLFVGTPDARGKTLALPMGGPVPFLSSAGLFTVAGLFGHINPILQDTMRAFGVDPISADANLRAQTVYNPTTGQREAIRPNLFGDLLSSFAPQTGAALDLITPTDQLKRLRKDNPEAFWHQFEQHLGLGFLPERVNLYRAAEHAERQRFVGFEKNLRQLVKGQTDISNYPQLDQLVPYAKRLKNLQSQGYIVR